MVDSKSKPAWQELESRLRRCEPSLSERADAYVRSVRRRRGARTPTDRYGVIQAPPLHEG